MTLTIYILCRNRPDFAKDAILSVLNQTCQDFKLIISDHSSGNDVEDMVKSFFPTISYVRRSPHLKHLEHFNLCIDEVGTDYYCLFHDDDIMSPDFVGDMLESILKFPGAAAYACNSYIEIGGRIERRLSFLSPHQYVLIESPLELARRYFARHQSGIAPNPSYIYARSMVGDNRFIVDGGKYADVSLLLDALKTGRIVWINKPLMTYRMHGNNVGSIESIPDRLRFLGYLKKNKSLFNKELLQDYRQSFIYKKVFNACSVGGGEQKKIVQSFLQSYYFYYYTRISTYKALLARALIKWGAKN